MEAISQDGTRIHFEVNGQGEHALVFVHGWLGALTWWAAPMAAFSAAYTTVGIDLGGHGQSARTRTAWTAEAYADDICAVVLALTARDVTLVAHSMAGAYALLAAPRLAHLRRIVLVDTVKDVEGVIPPEMLASMLALYRRDFHHAITQVAPGYLFAPTTPAALQARLQAEFLAYEGVLAADMLAPLYTLDVAALARATCVPVRGIGGDLHPTNLAANQAAFADYQAVDLLGCGHYPMLEQPAAFIDALWAALG